MAHYIIQLISDALSIITISSCLILKVPQIMKIHSMKSAEGMSMTGLALELFSYSTTFLYNYCMGYSLLSYMEYPIILLQEWVLICCVFYYQNSLFTQPTLLKIALYGAVFMGFFYKIIPTSVLMFALPICTPISASSKVIFLYAILKSRNSESISLLTWFISAFTNATRIFTIYFDSADFNLLMNFTISTFLSSSIMASAWFFKKKPRSD